MVSAYITPGYELSSLRQIVSAHFKAHALSERVFSHQRVVIKPNLLMKRRPEEVTTTHPALVEAVILELQAMGITDIVIAESSGGLYNRAAMLPIYRTCGLEDVANRTGVTLNEDFSSVYVENKNGVLSKGFELITPIAEADFIISLPKLKTHAMTGMSGGVKNLFGCIPGLLKPEYHWRFPDERDFGQMLVDLCETVKPDLTLVDAVISMEGDGPSAGTPKETGYTFCSASPYELDEYLCRFMGRTPSKIATVAAARERNLCSEFSDIAFVGDAFEPQNFQPPKSKKTVDFMLYVPKPLRPAAKKLVDKVLSPRPLIQTKNCIGCGKCAESCPAHTIKIENGKANINYDNCIKCFCCHEMCPVKAIDIRRSSILRL